MKIAESLHRTYLAVLPDAKKQRQADDVRKDLQRRLEVHVPHRGNIYLIGSARRKTDIEPVDDLDLFIELKAQHYNKGAGPDALLRTLKRAVEAAYGKTGIQIRTQWRSIRVTPPGSVVPFDLVLGVTAGTGFEIPDRQREAWIRSDPGRHVELLGQADQRVGGELRTLIRLVKVWARRHLKLIGSFHLEVLCWSVTELPRGRAEGLAALFGHLAVAVRTITRDPGGIDGPALDRHLTPEQRAQAEARFGEAQLAVQRALLDEQRGALAQAHRALRHLFGDVYPREQDTSR